MKKYLLLLTAVSALFAEESSPASFEEFLRLQTSLATKERLNSDYAPGIISVLRQEDLRLLGAESVPEALQFLPGFDVNYNTRGISGIGGIYGRGKQLIMINGVAMNNRFEGRALYYVPIRMVDRIEVIRGPGSSLYGGYAFTAVINIVTLKDVNQAFGRYVQYSRRNNGVEIGGQGSVDEKGWQLNMSAAYLDTQGEELHATDQIGRRGEVEMLEKKAHLSADLKHDAFHLNLQYHHEKMGEMYGYADFLPPHDGTPNSTSSTFTAEAAYAWQCDPDLSTELTLGYAYYEFRLQDLHLIPDDIGVPYSEGWATVDNTYDEYRAYARGETHYSLEKHRLLAGIELSRADMLDNSTSRNWEISATAYPSPIPYSTFSGDQSLVNVREARDQTALYLQDSYQANASLQFTFGLRYDHFSDVGDAWSPRFSAVYQLNPHHIVKAQYAHAFRPPNFSELYLTYNPALEGNPELGPEKLDTLELAYVYRKDDDIFRATLFYTSLDEMILYRDQGNSAKPENIGQAYSTGIELEYITDLRELLQLNSNLSLIRTQDKETDEPLPGSADLLGNAALTLMPYAKYNATLWYHYRGAKHRDSRDPDETRPEADPINRFDLIFNAYPLHNRTTLLLQLGVKNMFNAYISRPAPSGSYADDYPLMQERTFWGSLAYRF
jgi:outer membrane receptor for ferrienterochelin and colicins